MRILYGVCGEGMGHAIRSAVVGEHLRSKNHHVVFASSGGAANYLRRRKFSVLEIPGLSIVKRDNAVSPLETAVHNVAGQALGLFTGLPSALASMSFRPDVVVTDFDPWSARMAAVLGVPLFALDSIHFLSRCVHPPEFRTADTDLTLAVVQTMVPFADHYFVPPLSFAGAPIAESAQGSTTLHLPVLRPEILRARTREVGRHLTVYLNDSAAASHVLSLLAQIGIPVHVWVSGLGTTRRRGSLVELPFSEAEFVRDLATSRAVVGTAGSLIGEAALLGRPMLALPMGGHWEQHLNGKYMERLGLGEAHASLSREGLGAFLERAPMYAAQARRLSHDGNRELLASLDDALSTVRVARRAS